MRNVRSGYSLLEVLIAILIFAMTMAPLMQLFMQSSREAESAYDYYQVNNAITLELEKLKSVYKMYPDVFRQIYPDRMQFVSRHGKYECTVTVTPNFQIVTTSAFDGSAVKASVTEVSVVASWASTSGKPQSSAYYTSWQ